MRHMRNHSITFAVLLGTACLSTNALAEYAVQVGAFSKPSQAFADAVRELGEVNTAQSDAGITVFTVGRYATVDAAQADLARIQTTYPDAFVRNMPAGARQPQDLPQDNAVVAAVDKTPGADKSRYVSGTTEDSDLWNSLSDEERRRVVYLDGVLHVKQGEQFVPLTDYRREAAAR